MAETSRQNETGVRDLKLIEDVLALSTCEGGGVTSLKLFVFETCPFCVRARLMAGLKGLSPELVYVAPGQTPAELEGRVDRLTVPILVDGETLIQDSTEIIRHFDSIGT
ncbi:glutaredoxin [Rhodobacteraceae bacterium KLH11]|nr:glutaredoxin [Rhodobacteraceae bacterium KLH11]